MIKYLIAIFLIAPLALLSQEFDPVKEAFETGNASKLRANFGATVELTINGDEMEVGRGDAENQMRAFFDRHPPRSFSVLHTGVSKSDVRYMIGTMVSGDRTYRVSIYLRKDGENYLIQSLEIEEN